MRPLDGVAELVSAPTTVVPQVQGVPTPVVVPMLVAAALSAGVAVALYRRRDRPGARALAVLALAAGWWSLAYALELWAPTLAGTVLFGRLAYVGIVVVPPAWVVFALAYTGRGWRLTRSRVAALAVVPAATLAAAWTTPVTGLVWASYDLVTVPGLAVTVLRVEYGPAFWLWTAYAYALTVAGTVVLVASVHGARLFRIQTAVLFVGVAAPWVGNLAFVAGVSPLDLTPVGFAVSAVALGSGFRRYRLLDVHPVTGGLARAELFERLPEAVVALDARGRVVDLNPSAEAVLATSLDEAVGTPLSSVAPALADRLADLEADAAEEGTTAVTDYVLTDPRRYYEVRDAPLRHGSGGRLVTLRDVTEQRRRQQRVTVLNRVLRHDLRNDVAVVESYAGLLVDDPGNETYVAGVARRAAEMRDLVETVRAVEGHLDAGEPRRSTVDVARVVRDRVAEVGQAYPDATVEADLPTSAWVRAMDLVGSAVDNLVENAVEHNDSATPWLRVSVDTVVESGTRYVEVSVADDGPPIPDRDRAVLVGDEQELAAASGLGLWLVNWITTESGGSVEHHAREPRGNVVTLRFRAPEGERYHGRDEGAEAGERGTDDPEADEDEAVVYREDEGSRGPGEPSVSTR